MARKGGYDHTQDQLIGNPIKTKNDKEGFLFEVRSYKGGEPRVAITRFYNAGKGDDGKDQWKKDGEKYRRLSIRCFRALMTHKDALDRALASWKPSGQKPKSDADEADFGD